MATRVYNLIPNLGKTRATLNNSSQSSLHCTYYWSSRSQLLLHTAMLTALGLPKYSTLKRFGWWVQSRGSYTSVNSLRIAAIHSTLTALTTTWVTGTFTYVIGNAAAGYTITPMSGLAVTAYNSWNCTAFFTWNGSNGIIFEMSRTATAGAGITLTGYWGVATAPAYGNIYHYYSANSSTFPLVGAGAISAHMPDLYMEWEYGGGQGSHWIGISL